MKTKYPIEYVSSFNLLDFPDKKDDYDWMQVFYDICDNAKKYHKALLKEGYDGFNFNIYLYKKIYEDIKEYNKHSLYPIDNHMEDLEDIMMLQYQYIWTEKINGEYRVKYPYNLINDVICNSEVPVTINGIINDIRISEDLEDTENAIQHYMSILTDKEADLLMLKYRDHKKPTEILDLYSKSQATATKVKIYDVIRRAKHKVRKGDIILGYFTKGYAESIRKEKEEDERMEKYRLEEYNEAKSYLEILHTPLQDAKYLAQSDDDRITIKKIVKNTDIKTIKDLHCTTIPDLKAITKDINGLGDKRLSRIIRNMRRYYNMNMPKFSHEAEIILYRIKDAEETVESFEANN